MEMTHKRPTEPGAYWFRDSNYDDSKPRVVNVRDFAGRLAIENWEIPEECERILWSEKITEPIMPND